MSIFGDSWSSKNSESPLLRLGVSMDPLAMLFPNLGDWKIKTGDKLQNWVSDNIAKNDPFIKLERKYGPSHWFKELRPVSDWAIEKPLDTTGIVLGSVFGAQALGGLGGGGGGGGAGSLGTGVGSELGYFSGGGTAGMAGVGGGNAGLAAANGVVGGGAGMGTYGGAAGAGLGTADYLKIAGQAMGQLPANSGASPGYGDMVNSNVGRPPVTPTFGDRIAGGLGRFTDALTPVDPRVAATMDPAYLKQLRGNAMLNLGLGMMGAAQGGGRLGEAAATGLGRMQAGFGRDIEGAYQRGVDEREQKRRDDILATSNTRYDAEQAYRKERDKVSDTHYDQTRQDTKDYRRESLESMERRAAARNKPQGVTLSDAAIDFAAKRLLQGEPASKVLANFGRGAQGAQNITAVQNRLADLAAEGGVSPQLMAVLTQELAADSRTRLELGAREGKIASRVEEAKQFAKIAGDASLKVPRGQFVPVSRLMQFTDTQLSNPELAAFKAANVSLINAYAAAVGGGVPTVHDKEAAEAMLSTAQSPEAYQAVVNQLITEMDAALAAPRNVMQEMREHDLGGGLGHPAPAPAAPWMPSNAPPAAAGPAPNTGGWSIRPLPGR